MFIKLLKNKITVKCEYIYVRCTLTFKNIRKLYRNFRVWAMKKKKRVCLYARVKSEIVHQSYINFTNEKKRKKRKRCTCRSDVNRWILDPSPHKTDGTALTRASITLRSGRVENRRKYRLSDLINPVPTTDVSLSQTLTCV